MRKKASGFLDRTILGIVTVLRETIESDTIALRRGFLQQCDPRFKLICIVLLLIGALMAKSIITLGILYLFCLTFAALSSISLFYFLGRTVLFIPLFSLCIALPAITNMVTPGDPVFTFTLFSHAIPITRQGIDSAVIFCARVLVSVSFTILLMLTTRHHVLLKVLRIVRVPKIFVMTMGMSYRYIFVLLDLIHHAYLGIKSRVGFVSSSKSGRRIVAFNMAGLWLRSYRLHSQVYDAMVSRGYCGEPVIVDDLCIHAGDFLLLTLSLIALTGTLWLNLSFH
jgi:cobalt/nickel transport system permease protein